MKSIVFFPGKITDTFPYELYNNFLSNLGKEFNVFIADTDNNQNNRLLNNLSRKYNDICLISHSSGAPLLIDLCNINYNVNKVVLIDPIDLNLNRDRNKLDNILNLIEKVKDVKYNKKQLSFKNLDDIEIKLNELIELDTITIDNYFKYFNNFIDNYNPRNVTVNNLLLVNTNKSRIWRLFPTMPPISFLNIKIQNNNKKILNYDDIGHFDLFDVPWADFMHKTISKGNSDRVIIEEYHRKTIK